MSDNGESSGIGAELRAKRRRRQLTLRELSGEIGVSFNTLSRVERGFLPDLKNYTRIMDWLGVESATLPRAGLAESTTPAIISKHLFSDARLQPSAAEKIASLVQDLYDQLAAPSVVMSVHLRSAQVFLPEVGPLLADALTEMRTRLEDETRK